MTRLWPHLWATNASVKVRFGIALVLLIASKVLLLYVPLLYKAAVNALSPELGAVTVVPIFIILAYGSARLISQLFGEIRDAVFAEVTQAAIREIALIVFKHIHALSLRFHLERQTGGLSRVIERGTKAIETLLTFLTFNIIPTILEILLVAILFAYMYGISFASVIILTLGAYIIFTLMITEWRISYVRTMNETDNEATTKAVDSLLNYETVKYFNNEDHEAYRFGRALERYKIAAVKNRLGLSLLNSVQAFVITIGLVIIMLMAGFKVKDGSLTVGDFVALNAFVIQIYIPLNFLGFAYREIKIALVNMEHMFNLLDIPQEVKDMPNAPAANCQEGSIVFQNVSFHYDDRRSILNNISFEVPAGKTVAIVGSSGAGKSTISRLLFRFYDTTAGAILIDGQDIKTVMQDSLRQLIGIVPQDTVLFNDTIRYNIAYGRPSASEEEIIEAAQAAQIHDFILSLPDGYKSMVGERGLKLSGGEKQRVAIARTLLKQPKIFLFDEATSALDTRTEREIQKSLERLSKNHTTLIIAHRLSTVIQAHEILVLENGQIVERGSHKDLLTLSGIYTTMWERQSAQSPSA
ncbi:metal ABC transporter permease [Candidatus Paracaedibacter acanthamoebae]|uniref:Metal ABC transporter permease n=2 Tax=Candidatus Odyssella acanthamoebae TaxID=91604 RepID=A0A077ASA5_9PROT|nr:metal ABC transporter permease [Candidatus Paracaedibacter acanthamoebae]